MKDRPRLERPAGGKPAGIGIVHLGLGAFFRAHGAIYLQEAMALSGGDWGICGVSLRHPDQRDRLAPQGCVYHACELGPDGTRPLLVTAVREVLVAPEDPGAVLDRLCAPGTRIVSLTVTEKGYCHVPATGRLDFSHADIRADLGAPEAPRSAIGFICRAMARRREAGLPPLTVLCCDNLPSNGRLVRGLVIELAAAIDRGLAGWIEAEARFPATMVDRIVPATTAEDIAAVEAMTGLHDAAPVMHEPFRQWVIEDDFVGGVRPDLAAVGAQMVQSVEPFELMKLRCLNGTHSALAYLGYLAGCETIFEVTQGPGFAGYAAHLWAEEIVPTLEAPPGVDLGAYCAELWQRYCNGAIRHRTWQIAMDGSQKLPQRILGTLADNIAAGRMPAGMILALAGWMCYTSGRNEAGAAIDVRDPFAADFAAIWAQGQEPVAVVAGYLEMRQIFPAALAGNAALRAALGTVLAGLMAQGAAAAVQGIGKA